MASLNELLDASFTVEDIVIRTQQILQHISEAPHPSPLSAHRGFFGSKPYSKINAQLEAWGEKPIDFCL